MKADATESLDIFDGFGNGSLHMYIVCSPDWKPYKEGDVRYLDLDFHFIDWEALYFGVLGAHRWDPYVEGEDVNEHHENNRKKFHASIPEFPRLRTIYSMYEDYRFDSGEAKALRDECLTLISRVEEPVANKALRKLIFGCNQAIAANCTLMFVCD